MQQPKSNAIVWTYLETQFYLLITILLSFNYYGMKKAYHFKALGDEYFNVLVSGKFFSQGSDGRKRRLSFRTECKFYIKISQKEI